MNSEPKTILVCCICLFKFVVVCCWLKNEMPFRDNKDFPDSLTRVFHGKMITSVTFKAQCVTFKRVGGGKTLKIKPEEFSKIEFFLYYLFYFSSYNYKIYFFYGAKE